MKRNWLFSFLFIYVCLFFAACTNNSSNAETGSRSSSVLEGKWFYNSNDNRYYYEFFESGAARHQYYQDLGSIGGSLNTFVTQDGSWGYLNNEKTKFWVGWKSKIAENYDIVSKDDEKIVVRKKGASACIELLKSAKTVSSQTLVIPNEIAELIGTWYFSEEKTGKNICFLANGKCCYHRYQELGSASGWVDTSGDWSWNSDAKILSIGLDGGIAYHYEIQTLSSSIMQLKKADARNVMPDFSESQFYK